MANKQCYRTSSRPIGTSTGVLLAQGGPGPATGCTEAVGEEISHAETGTRATWSDAIWRLTPLHLPVCFDSFVSRPSVCVCVVLQQQIVTVTVTANSKQKTQIRKIKINSKISINVTRKKNSNGRMGESW